MKVILLLVSCFLLVSCGPSVEEKAAAEKAQQDSIAAAQLSAQQVKKESQVAQDVTEIKRPKAHYIASQFGLPPGIVYDFSPSTEYINECVDGNKSVKIFAHILHDDQTITVHEISFENYTILELDDVLK